MEERARSGARGGLAVLQRHAKRVARVTCERAGVEVTRRPRPGMVCVCSHDHRRKRLLDTYGVDLVLDVGASRGVFGYLLRATGYEGRIRSFEPLSPSFAILQEKCADDPRWVAEQTAIGDMDGVIALNVSANRVSSSVLPIACRHVEAAPEACYVDTVTVPIARLDSVARAAARGANTCLKMDVQGYEDKVLSGAEGILDDVVLIESELSLCSMYDGQVLWRGMVQRLSELGFEALSIQEGFVDPATGCVLQVDGIFGRALGR
jgi:FkbM family methyltransferase